MQNLLLLQADATNLHFMSYLCTRKSKIKLLNLDQKIQVTQADL